MLEPKEQDMIDHVNEDHVEELMWVVKAFAGIQSPEYAQITDVDDKSVSLMVTQAGGEALNVQVPFTAKGDLDERAMLLFLEARQRLGIKPKPSKKRYFEVKDIQYASPNILSLTLSAIGGIEDEGKLTSARFALKKLSKVPKSDEADVSVSGMKKISNDVFNKLALFVMKKSSSHVRRKLLGVLSGAETRTYTYSKIDTARGCVQVDVFLHGERNTPANVWALSLEVGDIIRTASENQVDVDYLKHGQALLCADETGFPAIHYLLSKGDWAQQPVVLALSNSESEFAYLSAFKNLGADVHFWCVGDSAEQLRGHDKIIQFLDQSGVNVDVAWGGLEVSCAKQVKQYLKEIHQVMGKKNGIHPYWVCK